jgi:hypothetical protein
MEWQQYVLDIILEIDPETGEFVYTEWNLTVPRQSGKSTLVLAKSVHRCSATKFFGPNQRISYAAQTKLKAVAKFENDYANAIRQSARFGKGARRAAIRTGNQKVDVRFANGSVFGVEGGTEKSGHGDSIDEGLVDEAFSQPDNRLEQAFKPAMLTRINRQLGVVSTMGWLDASPYFMEKVRIGRQLVADDVRVGVAYFEWSAPDDADPADEGVWLGCMPALHRPDCPVRCRRHTVRIQTIRDEYAAAARSGKLSDFRRAYLNQAVLKPKEGEETALGNWTACGRRLLAHEFPKVAAFGLAVAADRESVSIGAAGFMDDGLPLVAMVAQYADTDEAFQSVGVLSAVHECPVVIDIGGPSGEAAALAVESAGGRVIRTKLADYVAACADIYDRVHHGRLIHNGGSVLADSVTGARWRPAGDGRRVFGRKVSETNVAPLESVTLALRGALVPMVEVSVFSFDSLDVCDRCEVQPHDDPDGDHDYLCADCREEAP